MQKLPKEASCVLFARGELVVTAAAATGVSRSLFSRPPLFTLRGGVSYRVRCEMDGAWLGEREEVLLPVIKHWGLPFSL